MKYSRSCLVQWHDQNGEWLERVLEIDTVTEELACIRVGEASELLKTGARPFWRTKESLERALDEERARVVDNRKDPYLKPPVDPKKLSLGRRREWETICEAMKPIVNDPKHRILRTGKKGGGLVVTAAAAAGVTRRTIYRLLLKFWKGGQTMQCFLPDYGSNAGKTRQFKGGKKRGRRNLIEKKEGHKMGISIKPAKGELIFASLKRHFVGETTFRQAYDLMIIDLYCDPGEVRDGVLVPVPRATEEIPTLKQAHYIYQKGKDPEHEAKVREGSKFFNLKGRAITGNTESRLAGPGEVGQMDATTADIYLRSEHDPNLIVGRPVIYAIKDAWGRFLYSITVGFERPSYWGGAIALETALVDKAQYCAQLGISISTNEWPVDFLPAKLLVDKGEMSMYQSDHLVSGLGMQIDSAPTGRGDLKGIIEQQFRLNDNRCINWLPGALPRIREDHHKRYEFDALLTISEFRRLLIKSVLHYHRSLLPLEYKLSADMIAAGVEPRPIELLLWGNIHRPSLYRRFPLDQARYHLLPHVIGKVTEAGVRVKRAFFTCERAVREKWYERARRHGVWDIEIAFDPRLADCVYFQVAKGCAIEVLQLTPDDRRFQGWTWEEIEEHRSNQNSIRLASKPQELQDRIALIATADSIVKGAKIRQKKVADANPNQSKAQQLGNIAKNQAAEKAKDRTDYLGSEAPATEPAATEAHPSNIVPLPNAKADILPVTPPRESALRKRLLAKLDQHKTENGTS